MRARTKKDGDREEDCWWMSTALRREKRQEVATESSHLAQWLVRLSESKEPVGVGEFLFRKCL